MKSTFAFAIAALAALVLIIGLTTGLHRACGSGGAAGDAVPVRYERLVSPEKIEKAVFVRGEMPAIVMQAAFSNGWQQRFWCGTKVTDIVMAGFALFLALALFFQGLWISRGLRATEQSALIVDRAMISSQRAYVVFKEFKVDTTRLSLIEDIQNCAIQPIWENGGTTPTRSGRTHVNWRYFDGAIPPEFDLADFDESGNRVLAYESYTPLVIGPKGAASAPVVMLDAATLRQVRDQQGRVLIWGWAEYDDVFNASGRHRTEFCYQLVVAGNPTHYVGFSQYRRYNGVDEDCERKPTIMPRV